MPNLVVIDLRGNRIVKELAVDEVVNRPLRSVSLSYDNRAPVVTPAEPFKGHYDGGYENYGMPPPRTRVESESESESGSIDSSIFVY